MLSALPRSIPYCFGLISLPSGHFLIFLKYMLRGSISFTDGLIRILQRVHCGADCIQYWATSCLFSQRPPLQNPTQSFPPCPPKPCHLCPTKKWDKKNSWTLPSCLRNSSSVWLLVRILEEELASTDSLMYSLGSPCLHPGILHSYRYDTYDTCSHTIQSSVLWLGLSPAALPGQQCLKSYWEKNEACLHTQEFPIS